MRYSQNPPQDPVEKAHERARHCNGVLRNFLLDWKVAPGLPELRGRLQALGPLGDEMEASVTEATDVSELLAARTEIGKLVEAMRDVRLDPVTENLLPLRSSMRDLLASAYEIEQILDLAEREEVQPLARM